MNKVKWKSPQIELPKEGQIVLVYTNIPVNKLIHVEFKKSETNLFIRENKFWTEQLNLPVSFSYDHFDIPKGCIDKKFKEYRRTKLQNMIKEESVFDKIKNFFKRLKHEK